VESCGIQNVLTKSLGSANPHNVVRATFAGLADLRDPAVIRRLRGIDENRDEAPARRAAAEAEPVEVAEQG
jgi:ribosomal protein S5